MFKFLLCFIFLTMFPKNNLLYLTLTNTLELLVDFDRLLPIVINAVLTPKQKVYVDTSVFVIFVDAIRRYAKVVTEMLLQDKARNTDIDVIRLVSGLAEIEILVTDPYGECFIVFFF